MWYDDPFVKFKKRKKNRRRRTSREPILMVNARMLERRQERLRRVGAVLLCLVAVLGAVWLVFQGGRWMGRTLFSENDYYTVTAIDVSSDGRRIPPARIKHFAEVTEGVNLFAVSLGTIRQKLENLSLVQRAEVQRQLPDRLRISIVERVAIANLGPVAQIPTAIDRHGVVLGPSSRSGHLPTIVGVTNLRGFRPGAQMDDLKVHDALHLLDVCDTDAVYSRILKIRRIDVSHLERLTLTLEGDREVSLSRDDMLERLKELAAFVQQAEAKSFSWSQGDFTVAKNPTVR